MGDIVYFIKGTEPQVVMRLENGESEVMPFDSLDGTSYEQETARVTLRGTNGEVAQLVSDTGVTVVCSRAIGENLKYITLPKFCESGSTFQHESYIALLSGVMGEMDIEEFAEKICELVPPAYYRQSDADNMYAAAYEYISEKLGI